MYNSESDSSGPLAGLSANIGDILRRPIVLLLLLSLLFSLIVVGCIGHGGYEYDKCLFANDSNACKYAIWIGILALLACVGGLAWEVLKERMTNIRDRRFFIICQLMFSGIWSFLWFVGFCYLCNKWSHAGPVIDDTDPPSWKSHNCRAAIAFSFFSIFSWAGLAYLSYCSYCEGAEEGLFAYTDYSADYVPPIVPPAANKTTNNAMSGDLSSGGYQQFYSSPDPPSYNKSPY